VEASEVAVLAADRDDAITQHVERDIVAGLRRVVDVAHDVPGLAKDLLALQREEAWVGVEPSG
jgi:hypothetical protein